ncbi:phage shock protein operon transcriptional activator [Pelagicoccus sp. NFK12]|uniref:Phage shock protein operon transcriptional activator n=1 Tax=Pelagicoccus enzymogenes TaxID=2773457 RepID=A0A927F5X1_9BACT|nr:phage shock protein operon transcriptional activator [Pelagicoccus enzymogenes]MBD5779003.1 phage shock protein operon transcriptional activator [Pelagicoccus enzymogenes]MDQ8200706.1 phage shock protein operon transcriptional activator [Pelagicoccus enzymogenes]
MSQDDSEQFGMGALPEALGVSEAFLDFQQRLSAVAKIDRPVLLIGERGTGKELAAARLHFLSQRWQGPLVALNCAALSESVLESELFGHEAGAFTGAVKRREGRFEAADGGTLFLDEIGLVSMTVQEKILRAVEYGVFQRVGGSSSVKVNARIVGATNADLSAMSRDGKFKSDLLDRLSFDVLYLPPLRSRREDIEYLAMHFAAGMARELEMAEVPDFSAAALDSLQAYDWPGNVRELKNVVERSVYRSGGGKIRKIEFDPFVNPFAEEDVTRERDDGERSGVDLSRPLHDQVKALEISLLRKALLESGYKQQDAANKLGLTYYQFRALYRKYKDEL